VEFLHRSADIEYSRSRVAFCQMSVTIVLKGGHCDVADLGHQFGPNSLAFFIYTTDNAIIRLNKTDKRYLHTHTESRVKY
jgi:hypothetical protein